MVTKQELLDEVSSLERTNEKLRWRIDRLERKNLDLQMQINHVRAFPPYCLCIESPLLGRELCECKQEREESVAPFKREESVAPFIITIWLSVITGFLIWG